MGRQDAEGEGVSGEEQRVSGERVWRRDVRQVLPDAAEMLPPVRESSSQAQKSKWPNCDGRVADIQIPHLGTYQKMIVGREYTGWRSVSREKSVDNCGIKMFGMGSTSIPAFPAKNHGPEPTKVPTVARLHLAADHTIPYF